MMNEILKDLNKALDSVSEFYYGMPTVVLENDNLDVDEEEIKYYERRFVAQIKSEYDKLIANNETENYEDVNTDLEVIKKYIYSEPDNKIVETYKKLNQKNDNKTFKSITTIPDFFIHKEQDNKEKTYQKLVVEAKTAENIDETDLFLDLFKLNVYAEKYNFQNCVFIITNNETNRVKKLSKKYLTSKLYLSPNNLKNIYLFIKPKFGEKTEVIRLIDLK
jgi:hypothetical protein